MVLGPLAPGVGGGGGGEVVLHKSIRSLRFNDSLHMENQNQQQTDVGFKTGQHSNDTAHQGC